MDFKTARDDDLLYELRRIIDEREDLEDQRALLWHERQAIEAEFLKRHEAQGVTSFPLKGTCTVSFKPATRVTVDPEQWESLYQWAVSEGHTGCLYKQISNKQMVALAEDGEALPKGVSFSEYTKVSVVRR